MGEHRPLVAVTFPADTERLAELLGDAAQVEPVADLPDPERTRTLAAADVLFAWNWRRELRPEEGPTLGWAQSSLNRSVKGAVCAILGFGGIGKATGRLLRALPGSTPSTPAARPTSRWISSARSPTSTRCSPQPTYW